MEQNGKISDFNENQEIEKRLKMDIEAYLKSEDYLRDISFEKNEYFVSGKQIPSDEIVAEEVKDFYIKQRRKEIECELHGHLIKESNPDPENGTSDAECVHCGETWTMHF